MPPCICGKKRWFDMRVEDVAADMWQALRSRVFSSTAARTCGGSRDTPARFMCPPPPRPAPPPPRPPPPPPRPPRLLIPRPPRPARSPRPPRPPRPLSCDMRSPAIGTNDAYATAVIDIVLSSRRKTPRCGGMKSALIQRMLAAGLTVPTRVPRCSADPMGGSWSYGHRPARRSHTNTQRRAIHTFRRAAQYERRRDDELPAPTRLNRPPTTLSSPAGGVHRPASQAPRYQHNRLGVVWRCHRQRWEGASHRRGPGRARQPHGARIAAAEAGGLPISITRRTSSSGEPSPLVCMSTEGMHPGGKSCSISLVRMLVLQRPSWE